MTENHPDAPSTPRPHSRRFRRASAALLTALAVLLPVVLEAGSGSATAQAAATGTRINRDVVVYGGTPAGVAAAVAAADRGARVTLLAEGSTVGGMMSNGISASDIGSAAAVQGVAKEFFRRIRSYYRDSDTWRFEPRVAERVLVRMLAEEGVKVRRHSPVTRVVKNGRAITCVVVPTDRTYCAKAFIDASYTGDVLAKAGAPHRLGYKDLLAYGENLAAQRAWKTQARAADGQAWEGNPFIRTASSLPPFSTAYAAGMPSLTYRLCVTTKSGNKTPFWKPSAYDRYVPTFRAYARKMGAGTVNRTSIGTLHSAAFQLARLPGGKYDLNAGYASFTNVPAPADYFTNRATRLQWNRVLRGHVQSFFYFIGHDPSVPDSIRTTFDGFGLCKDEFTDNGNWPREPYVREARRIDGQYTITVKDVYRDRTKTDAIALGSYNVDGKLSQLLAVGGTLYRDLSVHAKAPVYEIPFRAIQPKAVTNLLVPVGVSSSPTAYGTIRMEPQYMAMGQAAGIAAALAAEHDRTTRYLPVSWVQRGLRLAQTKYKALDICRAGEPSWRRLGGFDAACTVVREVEPRIG